MMRFRLLRGVLIVSIVLMVACSNAEPTRVKAKGTDSPTTVARSDIVFQGASFSLPPGWSNAEPGCGRPSDKTVVVGIWSGSCPGSVGTPRPSSWVRLTAVFGPQFVDGFSGEQVEWQGQTAWLSDETSFGVTTLRLSVPRLNVVIEAAAPDAADAHALLDRARPRPTDGLGVPLTVPAVFIEGMGGTDGDGLQHNVTVTSSADVTRLLDDLRNAEPVAAGTPACDGSWYRHTALLTVQRNEPAERTFAVRLDGCGQVVSGTGNAAIVSDHLRADILRLLPNSGLIA
jgi:hypothetical protein